MITRLALAGICGGNPRAIEDTITTADWADIQAEWKEHPPAHWLLWWRWKK